MHPDFRLIALANRPGYPFLGNDIYQEAGDCFSVHVIASPPPREVMQMLSSYAPSMPEFILRRCVAAFQELHQSYLDEVLTYPYSVRELVGVVRHFEAFPDDGISEALNNVLSLDTLAGNNPAAAAAIVKAFAKQSIPLHGSDFVGETASRPGSHSSTIVLETAKSITGAYYD